MSIHRFAACLLASVGSCGALSGCAEKSWLRPQAPSKVQTVASVGDKALPIVAGVPGTGATERAESEPLDPPRRSGSRIAGRVFDDRGKPVPNARVRLVVGGTTAGRDSFATTDRSGAFTMHDLRAGRYYTLVAESQSGGVRMTGQVEARAPRTGVRINVGDRPDARSAAAASGASVRPVRSRRSRPADDLAPSGVDDEELPRALAPDGAFQRQGNIDDPGPPADEAASRAPWEGRSAHARVARTSATMRSDPSRDGWETARGQGASRSDGRYRGPARETTSDLGDHDDDGENPLPPALESAPRGSRSQSRPRSMADRDLAEPGPLFIPDDELPVHGGAGASAVARDRFADGPLEGERVHFDRASRRSGDRDRSFNSEDVQEGPPGASRTADRSGRERPTWRDLSINSSQIPVDEAVGRSSMVLPDRDRGDGVVLARLPREDDRGEETSAPVRRVDEENAREPGGSDHPMDRAERPPQGTDEREMGREAPRRTSGPDRRAIDPEGRAQSRRTYRSSERPRRAARPEGAFCQLDTAARRLEDFQLPGLDGSMIAFRDVDADVIVLDFWGSWCEHCRKSVEFERDLKERFGTERVRVLGIACEKGKTDAERRASAAKAAMRLGIDYPVLVTTMDGACPVQKAFQVQFYPTLIVLDRSGRILHVERGATDATLGRIERAVSAALDQADEPAR